MHTCPLLGEKRSRANHGHSSERQPESMGRITTYTRLSALPLEAGRIQRNHDMQSMTLSPRTSYQCAVMGRPELWLVGRRLTVREWLVGSYGEGQRWPDPSSSSRRLDQRVCFCGKENRIGAHQADKRSTLPINGLCVFLIHIQKYDQKKKKKSEKKEQKTKRKTLTHFSASVNGGLSFSFSKGRLIL